MGAGSATSGSKIFPDGGVARLHVHGEVVPDPALLEGLTVDLAALENGADVAARSDRNYYSSPRNVILPGLSRVMGEGWETRRRRQPGHEWLVIRLAGRGRHRAGGDRHVLVPGQPARRRPRCRRWTPSTGASAERSIRLARPAAAQSGCCRTPRTGSG